MIERIRKGLWRVSLTTGSLVAGGWILHKLGLLPVHFVAYTKPLLVTGVSASLVGEAIPFARRLAAAVRFRWTKRVGAAGVALVTGVNIAWLVDRNLEATLPVEVPFLALLVLGGAALIYDAREGAAQGTLPRAGVWAAACAGAGLCLFGIGGVAGAWATAAGLAGIGAGAVLGSFARRQLSRAEAAIVSGEGPAPLPAES